MGGVDEAEVAVLVVVKTSPGVGTSSLKVVEVVLSSLLAVPVSMRTGAFIELSPFVVFTESMKKSN